MPDSINPTTGELIARYEVMSLDDITGISWQTHAAAKEWADVSILSRAIEADRAASVLERRKEELALLITREMGKPINESRAEIDKCVWVCQFYAEEGPRFLADTSIQTSAWKSFTTCEPLGVVLGVMPWNFPFWQVFRFAIPALTAGNGAILKHASNVTGCALAIESIFKEADYPANLFRTVIASGETVCELIKEDSIQAVTLTGSELAGSAVASAAGKALKKSVLELGGSDPYLVLEDADLDLAAEKCAQGRLFNAGQTCIAAKRFIVVSPIKDAFTKKLIARMKQRVMGDPKDENTAIGPMARPDLRDEIHDQVLRSIDSGAKLLMGGVIPVGSGNFYPPTVLTEVRPGMPAADEELFGPVAVVMEAKDIEDAVAIANASPFGLGSAVFTKDLRTAETVARRLETGTCFINDFVKSDPRMPFGGIKKSGYGRELAREGIREFVNIKSVVVEH